MPLPPMALNAPAPPDVPAGLLVAATGPLDLPSHMQNVGGTYIADACGVGHLYPTVCDDTPPYPTITLDAGDGGVTAYPFEVYASVICGSFGESVEHAEERARTRLALTEQTQVERALWHGGDGVTGIFEALVTAAMPGYTALAATTNVMEAVSLLEQQAANFGGQPLIHMRPRLAAYMGGRGQIRQYKTGTSEASNLARTQLGTPVVFGRGYAGTGPAGEVVGATDEYVWITGRVIVWRGEKVSVRMANAQAVDTATNQRAIIASRPYALAVECVLATTKVTRA